ncbi:hypothetical protein K9U34_01425 [Lawsonia intracellularis]|uniref:NA n=1 Tax=Lawsonia intracellularis (strain PHE/MN1-00) TaxID=363253 RepID=Q1MRN0_LAWIP|nr:hypothetical protein [Lawsonia intracellularis]AGC49700.1 hypothetical protein LAW_00299 [Lawsonia intracellularis N343]KAA0205206.1 hypothetical protein C4K43_01725 [Lawsonia intracellularis]MBZ3892265.1 hypothetical protein [Lawsonia intracellularis]OMQ04816.1 hypothetical protein BW722_01560 [Lawsonia intracellularis]RBN32247.1 hypothetical protein DR194_04650 [Lawsonia intracellularis]
MDKNRLGSFLFFMEQSLNIKRILFIVLLLCEMAFLVGAYWPGAMSIDSVSQYEQAVTHTYEDWHPPIMAWVWSCFILVYKGPIPMLLFHTFMFFGATALLCLMYSKKNRISWIWLILPLLPFIAGLSGVLWKDIGMAYAFFFAFALFHLGIHIQRQSYYSYLLFFLALCFFLYAFWVRDNAIMASAPIVYYLVTIGFPNWKKIYIFGVSCIILICLFCIGRGINKYMLDAKSECPTMHMKIDEIAATSRIVGKNLFFKESTVHEFPVEELPIVHLDKGWKFYSIVQLTDNLLKENWYSVMRNEPWAYLQAKLRLFNNFSRFPIKTPRCVSYFVMHKNNYGFTFEKGRASDILYSYVNTTKNILPILFLPIFWIPLAGILFLYVLKRNDLLGIEVKMLSSSAVCYYLGYFIVTPTPDYRFIYWIVLATTVATFLLLCDRYSYTSSEFSNI